MPIKNVPLTVGRIREVVAELPAETVVMWEDPEDGAPVTTHTIKDYDFNVYPRSLGADGKRRDLVLIAMPHK